jgi:hypothetical protein
MTIAEARGLLHRGLEMEGRMVRNIIRVATILIVPVVATAAYAASVTLGTVRITQPVLANAQPLPPGTYEVRLTDEHLSPNPGQSPDAEQVVEFVKDGMVVARGAAEVLPMSDAVGTSGGAPASSKLRVEKLKEDDFIRIATVRDGKRYLIYLPIPH